MTDQTLARIKREEGFLPMPAPDAGGFSVGYGTHLPLTEGEATMLLQGRLDAARAMLRNWPPYVSLNDVRRSVVEDMVYQLGWQRFIGFIKAWMALKSGDYITCAAEMRNSKWARQDTPKRAERLASMMETGNWDDK